MTRRRLPAGAKVSSFAGLSLRSLRARPLRSLLTMAAIVLGVGMVFGVLLLVGTIHSTFNRLYDSVYGRTDLVVSGDQGIGSLPASSIERVRAVKGVRTASGSVWSIFRTVGARGKVRRGRLDQVYVVGVDFAQPDTTDSEQVAGRNPIAGRNEIEVGRDWADKQHVGVGDRVRLSTPSGIVSLRVSGLYEFQNGLDLGGYGTASMPVADARRIMDKPGVWDEIDVVVDPGARVPEVQGRLDAALGRGVEVATPATKSDELQKQLSSMDTVLYFFSGIALFVGAFLILNSFNMTVLQRMREIGTLRALGASDLRVARTILAEALVLAVGGSAFGLGLGAGLAVLLVQAMQSFGMPVSSIDYSVGAVVGAVVVGLIATLAGALWPAWRAGRISPVQALTGSAAERRAPGLRRAVIGLLLFLPGMALGGLFWFADTSQQSTLKSIGGVAITMIMFVGMVRLAPFVVLPLVRVMSRGLRAVMPAEGRLASDAAQANPGRTAATAATLLVALSVVVVNATVASSFIGSVKSELDTRFNRDLTVQPLGYQDYGPPQSGITRRLRVQLAALPEAGAVARRRALFVNELPAGNRNGLIVAFDPYEYDRVDKTEYTGAPRAAVLRGLAAGGVAPSHNYGQSVGLRVGQRIRLTGPAGTRSARIVGFARTFDAGGSVEMSLATMASVYGIRTDSQLIVKAASPGQRAALARRVDALLARDYPGLEALSNADFKKRTTDAINQQFGFFNAIVGIAVLVGLLGIVNTLSMSVLERTREIGVLRALGASRWRVRRTMADESLLISLAGTFSGILAGLLVALVWVFSMQRSTFEGMSLRLPMGTLIAIAVLGVVMGVLAAILPARRAAKLDPLDALHYE